MNKYPNFLYIGPDKSGSTWLYNILKEHPNCFVPDIKDIYFFDRYYERGLNWYLSFFKNAQKQHRAIGEFSHDYLFSRLAAERIYKDLPNVKLLTCLRNPVDRTFSQYLHLIRSGITKLPLMKAIKKYPRLINNSLYYKHLSVYLDLFGKDYVKILIFDKLNENPFEFAREVFEFLDIPINKNINYEKRVLPSSKPRIYIFAKFAKASANLFRAIRLERTLGDIKNGFLPRFLYVPYKPSEKPALHPHEKEYLMNIFREDIYNLEKLINMSLKQWIN